MFSLIPIIYISSSSLVFSPEGRFWQEPEPSQATGMALAHCILGIFLGVGCHCFPPPLDVPTFASKCLHVQATWETSISERRNYGREMAGQFCLWFRLPRKSRVLWHAAQICDIGRHAVDFFARKIRWLRPGWNPRSWVPEASMLTTRPPKPLKLEQNSHSDSYTTVRSIATGLIILEALCAILRPLDVFERGMQKENKYICCI